MDADASTVAASVFVTAALFGALLGVVAWHTTRNTPAQIVRRLRRAGRPVVVRARGTNLPAWDPSKSMYTGGFWNRGTATYSLDSPTQIRVRFVRTSGEVIERSGAIPAALLPDPPELRRRKRIARAMVLVYVVVGVIAFAVPALLVDGTDDYRSRIGAISSLAAVSLSWLAVHLVITARRHRHAHAAGPPTGHPLHPHARRVGIWVATYVGITTAFALAWKIGNTDEPHPMSWATAFLSAATFVLAAGAALAASLHHHTYFHHTDSQGKD